MPEAERIPGIPGPQFLSADDHHIQTSQRIGDDSVFEKFRWTIYARDTKEIVGHINSHVPLASFFVTGSHVILVTEPYARREEGRMRQEPLRIRAVDLRTGVEAWSHDVRDTEYRGPYPP